MLSNVYNNVSSFWNGDGKKWHGYKATSVVTTAAILNEFLDYYWLFTSLPLPGQKDSQVADKFFYMLAQLIFTGVKWGAVGITNDYTRSIYNNQKVADNNKCLGYIATGIVLAAIINELLDYEWIFTSLPLIGQQGSQVADKVFFMLAQVICTVVMWGTVGMTAYYVHSLYNDIEETAKETSKLTL